MLKAAAGTVQDLRLQETSLLDEIAGLEEQRRPLILGFGSTSRRGFACTGSMEPTITCLDEATWVRHVRPEDITVGATITYDPDCSEEHGDGIGRAHRVVDIKFEDGQHWYWPQGDANEEPDGCWVPAGNIRGYIIEIHRNAVPENAPLRDIVNAARADYEAAANAYDVAEAKYLAILERHCGQTPPELCFLNPGPFAEADAAYRAHIVAYRRLTAASDLWECWTWNAINSEYPGHIPLPCLQPIQLP